MSVEVQARLKRSLRSFCRGGVSPEGEGQGGRVGQVLALRLWHAWSKFRAPLSQEEPHRLSHLVQRMKTKQSRRQSSEAHLPSPRCIYKRGGYRRETKIQGMGPRADHVRKRMWRVETEQCGRH